MKKIANILVIYNPDALFFNGLGSYIESVMHRYKCGHFKIEYYSLEELKNNEYQQIRGTCYEGLFLSGNFILDDLSWPIRRQRSRYKDINT